MEMKLKERRFYIIEEIQRELQTMLDTVVEKKCKERSNDGDIGTDVLISMKTTSRVIVIRFII